MKILIVDDNDDIRDLVQLMIESEFDHEVTTTNSGNGGIELLQKAKDIGVIISDYNMPNGTGGVLYKYVKENYQVPFILMSGAKDFENDPALKDMLVEHAGNSQLNKPFDHDHLIESLQKAFDNLSDMDEVLTKQKLTPLSERSQYLKMRCERIKGQSKYICDTHINLSGEKFVKIGSKGEVVEPERVQSYIDKGVDFFYLDKDEFTNFLNSRTAELAEKLSDESLDFNELVSLQLDSIEQVQEVVKSIGVKKPVIDLTDKVAKSVTTSIVKQTNLKKFLSGIVKKKNFFFEQTNIMNYLCGAMVKELGWDKEKSTAKFIFASMFIDVSLDSEELGRVIDMESEAYKNLPLDQKCLVKDHVFKSLDIFVKSRVGSGDEEKLIQQHHERPNGKGFPHGLNSKQLPPLSAVFILAHQFSYDMIMTGNADNIDPQAILDGLDPAFNTGNFSKPYAALKKALDLK